MEAKQRNYMGPRSICSPQFHWVSCLSCLALSFHTPPGCLPP